MLYYVWRSGLPAGQMLVLFLGYFFAILIALCSHELAHGLVAYWCGDQTAKSEGRLSLNPFKQLDLLGTICLLFVGFGWAKPVPVNPLNLRNYKRDMALVSISGVLTNLILAFIFCPLLMISAELITSTNLFLNFVYYFLYFAVIINVSLAVFNIIPIYPLDGFNFINTFLSYGNKFSQFMYRYGQILLLILFLTGGFSYIFGWVTEGTLWLFKSFWGLMI